MVREDDINEANKPENKITKKGIEWERSCTDVICCLIFVVFLGSMVAVTGLAISEGDPVKIMTPFDSDGNKCGQPDQNGVDFTDFPYKHFTSLISQGNNIFNAVCVEKCPLKDEVPNCITNDDVDSCPEAQYDTELLFSYCMPSRETAKEVVEQVYAEMNQ
mmetsp:Transcript_14788/g.25159  ORF Transcript_14788/g.25159 Transcript_14788/m.25159 type:complete len:161 (+) Transcript_14788:50-532(+)